MISQPMLQTQIQTYMAAVGGIGQKSSLMATATAQGVITWCGSALIVNTVDVGSAGGGSGMGKVTIPLGPLMLTMATGMAAANGIQGAMGMAIVGAIAQAIGDHLFTFGIINTTHAGVGVGTGIASFVAPAPALFASLQAAYSSYGLLGTTSPKMCKALSDAVSTVMSSAVGMVVIAGAPSTSAGSGSGTGKLT
jgi:hypothetical protein